MDPTNETRVNYWTDFNSEICFHEMFEDTKVVIRNRKSKKDRQHNDQKKKDKRTITIYKTLHGKAKTEEHQGMVWM